MSLRSVLPVVLSLAAVSSLHAQESVPYLWNAADHALRVTDTTMGVTVDRLVEVDPQVVDAMEVGGAVKLLLPGDFVATARLDEELPASGALRGFDGRIEEDPFGSFTVVADGDLVIATVRTKWTGLVQVRRDHDAIHVVQQVDETSLPGCGTDHRHHVNLPGTSDGGLAPQDDGSVFDIMVVWTTQAENAAGGQAAMNALVDLAFIETNAAYTDSGVNSRVRLVYKSKISYDESSDFGGHLSRLRSTTDGYMDEVHAIRDEVGADQVALLCADGQYCGIAYLMTSLSNGFESSAFSVTNWSCATGYYSFGHELGHNQGCHHDHDNASGALFPYSYGYRFNGNSGTQWRTMLAYAPGSRIRRLSNPNETFDGVATGISGTGSNAASNARSLNEAATTVANWRNETLQPTGILFSTRQNESLGGVTYAKGDIIRLNLSSGNFTQRVDISDLIPSDPNVTALARADGDDYLLAFEETTTVPGLIGGPNGDEVTPQDVVRLSVTQYGSTTVGTIAFEFDGSDVGLTDVKEAIDALSIAEGGDLVMSFFGPFDVGGGISGKDEDMARFAGSYGANTSGGWTFHFDGSDSDVRLAGKGEDIDALHYLPGSGSMSVSTTGSFRVPKGRRGEDDDLLTFLPTGTGTTTTGLWMNLLEGGFYGLTNSDIDGVSLILD